MGNEILKNNFFTKIQTHNLAVIVLALAILLSLFNYGNQSLISNVQGQYLIEAKNLHNGEAPQFTKRPVYPYLLSLSFALGEDHFSIAHWLTQGVYFLTILIIFILANYLYGKWVAFVSTVAIILSIRLFLVSWTIGVSYLVTVFILSSFLIYLKGLKDRQRWMFFAAGIAFGIGYLTKENSLFYIYFPLSLMVFLKDYRSKFAFKGYFLFLTGITIVIIPWLIFLAVRGQNLLVIFGEFYSMGGISFFGHKSIWQYAFDVIVNGTYGTVKELAKEMSLFLIMLIGLISIFWGGLIKHNKSDKIFISLIIPSIPVLTTYGIFLDGFRQIILSILFLHIALGKLIVQTLEFKRKKQIYILTAGAISILVMIILDIDRIKLYSKKYGTDLPLIAIQKRVTGNFGLEVIPGGRFNEDLLKAANWIKDNVKKGSLLGVGSYFDHSLAFFTNLNYRYGANLPKRSYTCDIETEQQLMNVKQEQDQIVQLTTPKQFKVLSQEFRYRSKILSLYKNDLIDFLKYISKEKMWLIINENEEVNFTLARSLINDLTKKVYTIPPVGIYETIPGKYDFDSLINKKSFHLLAKGSSIHSKWLDTARDLLWLKNNKPNEFERYSNCFLLKENINLEKLL